jgi:transposase-like protein
MAYTDEDKQSAFKRYRQYDQNLSRVAKDHDMPSRGTLHNWKDEGDWDERIRERRQERLQRVTEEAPEVDLAWGNGTTESVLEADLQKLYTEMRRRLQASESVPRPRDLIKLAETLQNLANADRERVAWMKRMATMLVECVVQHVDNPAALQRIQSSMQQRLADEEHQLLTG